MNPYQKTIQRVMSGELTRKELEIMRQNALEKFGNGDIFASEVVQIIDKTIPKDKEFIFMGFCPNGEFVNRLDIEWRRDENCTYEYLESAHQLERFLNIRVGDLIVLKKIESFGKTMCLFGFGRVLNIKHLKDGHRELGMKWSPQETIIETPLMGCNGTVDVKAYDNVVNEMPIEFWNWLGDYENF